MVYRVDAHPDLSVVIVNFNSGAYVTNAVTSVLESEPAAQIIVVDNNSSDDSVSMLRHRFAQDDRVLVLQNRRNLGFARASNRGIKSARGRYILLLNPDCVVRAGAIEKLIAHMEQRKDVGMVGCVMRNIDGTEQAGSRRVVPTPWRSFVRVTLLDRIFRNHPRFNSFCRIREPLPSEPIEVEAISGAFMLVRREAVQDVGLLDKKYFLHCEDLDWCMRFRAAGWKVLFVPDVDVTHHKGVCSRSRPVRVLWHKHVGMMRFYGKFFRHQYPLLLMAVVGMGVWGRFTLLAGKELGGHFFARLRRRSIDTGARAAVTSLHEIRQRSEDLVAPPARAGHRMRSA